MSEKITFKVNGRERTVELEGWERGLDVLRENLGLTGSKRGCDDATCGACTVVVNGEAKKSCVLLAKKLDGADILTIEGISKGKKLHPIQDALIEAGAVQCGYCTPGFVMSAVKLLEARPRPTKTEIEQALTGNLCRCTGYAKIIQAVETASRA